MIGPFIVSTGDDVSLLGETDTKFGHRTKAQRKIPATNSRNMAIPRIVVLGTNVPPLVLYIIQKPKVMGPTNIVIIPTE